MGSTGPPAKSVRLFILVFGGAIGGAGPHAALAQCELRKLVACDGYPRTHFGLAVAISGSLVAVGESAGDNALAEGSAYVFRIPAGSSVHPGSAHTLIVRDTLLPASDRRSEFYGSSVSVNGDLVLVGDPGANDVCPEDRFCFSGAVYVFRRCACDEPSNPADDCWMMEARLTAPAPMRNDSFGASTSIGDGLLAVGAPGDDEKGVSAGAAYVFSRNNSGTAEDDGDDYWELESKLTARDAAAYDSLGRSISVDGGRVVVGADGDDDVGNRSGSAYVFRRTSTVLSSTAQDILWVEERKLTPPDSDDFAFFGESVSLRGHRIVVGAIGDDHAGSNSGAAYVFRWEESARPSHPADDLWVLEIKLTASDGAASDFFGASVAIGDGTIVVGAPGHDSVGPSTGAAYVFRLQESSTTDESHAGLWTEDTRFSASDADVRDQFGVSVAIDGERAVVGAPFGNDVGSSSGAAYLFSVDGPDCNENDQIDLCDLVDGTSPDINANGIPDECEPVVTLDIKPRSCPNPLNPNSRGVVPMAIVGGQTFDVSQIDIESLVVSRADGVGGSVVPLTSRHGPRARIEDVSTSSDGELCHCDDLGADGIDDLVVKFSTQELVRGLALDSLDGGTEVILTLKGRLFDGTEFSASDCILTVGRATINKLRPPRIRQRNRRGSR